MNEAKLLGYVLMGTTKEAVEKVKKFSFTKSKHKIILDAMLSLAANNKAIDTVSVYQELKRINKIDEVGGAAYLSRLTQDISHTAEIEKYLDNIYK